MATARKATTATKSETSTKKAVKMSIEKKAPTNKLTNTQVRKTRSPSVRNKAPQEQIKAVEKIAAVKNDKIPEAKMERDSFTMPKEEYAQIAILKKRLSVLGQPAKKSELLRAGLKLLSEMTDAKLKQTLASVPVIKTGRPKKKK